MWTMTTVTRRTSTSTTRARSEHACTLVDVCLLCHTCITLHIGSRSLESVMMCGCLWVSPLHLLFLPAFLLSLPVLPLHALRQLWLHDKQPPRLRQRDLRLPGGFLTSHRLWAQRHGVHQRHGAQRLGPQQVHWLPGFPRPLCPSSDHDVDDGTLGKLLAEVHRDYADYRCPEGVSVSPSSMSVASDRTEKLVKRSDIDHFGFSARNMYSAQNQFPLITQAERMVDRTGKLVGITEVRESSSAQIRTLCNEQRRTTIIAKCCETVSHRELQAARAKQERKIPQEELWRQ